MRSVRLTAWTLLLCFIGHECFAQKEAEERIIAEIMEKLTENHEDGTDFTDLQDQLGYFSQNKADLNKVTREQLLRLVFLDEREVNAIIEHRTLFGDYLSIYELQVVRALDEVKLAYLTCFVTVGESNEDRTPFMQMFGKGKHEFIGSWESTFQSRAGYNKQLKAEQKSHYLGNDDRYTLRYRFAYGTRLKFGYAGEKDKGEQFGQGAQAAGFDFNSVHFYYRPAKGIIKAISIGDYLVSFGQGLTFGQGTAGKSAFVMNVRSNAAILRPYRSVNESGFLRGAAILMSKQDWQVVFFGSRRPLSTNLGEDKLSFSSISQSGLHRTLKEAEQKNNAMEHNYGLNLQRKFRNNHIGFTSTWSRFDAPVQTKNEPWQLFDFKGSVLFNSGIDYNLQWRNAVFFGEAAIAGNHSSAILSGLMVSLDMNLDVVFVYRNYAKDYQASFHRAFGEQGDGRNEQGLYSGMGLKINRKWLVNLYADIYESKWMRYLVDGPSRGVDIMAEIQYQPGRSAQLYLRYRHKSEGHNQPQRTDVVTLHQRKSFRFNARYKVDMNLNAVSRAEVVYFSDGQRKNVPGVLLFQDIGWSTGKKRCSLNLRGAAFTVDDYDARVYATESDVLYQYAVPLFQNSGVRYYIVARIKLGRKMELWCKFSETIYNNISSIGSGLEEIKGNRVTDLRLQFRLMI